MEQASAAAAEQPAFDRCRSADSIRGACQGLADDLLAAGVELPSVYLVIGGRLRCQAAHGYFQVIDGFTMDAGVIGRTVTSGQPVVVPDVTQEPGFIAAIPGLRGEIRVPVIGAGEVVGAVNAESTSELPAGWLELLTEGAAVLAERIVALGGLPAESFTQRLARAVVEMTALTDEAAIAAHTVRAARELSGMNSGCLARRGAAGRLRVVVAEGPLGAALAASTDAQLESMAAWVRAGTSSHFPDGAAAPDAYDFLAAAGVRAMSVHSLTVRGAQRGILVLAHSAPLAHDPARIEGLELLAAQAGTSLASAGAVEALRRRAEQDPLTGLCNVARFEKDLASMLRSTPTGRACACLMIDVDYFKQVNDLRGHLAGDDLLRRLARVLSGVLRGDDQLYRIGGDEFAALLVVRDAGEAVDVAQRLLAAADAAGSPVSIGLAVASHEEPGPVRDRADRALYEAKHAGRNTVRRAG